MNAGERKQKQIIKLNIKNLTQIKQKEKIKQSNQTKKREESKEGGKRIENYIEQKFKIQKQQQPFYRILELALLNKEKIVQEKTYQIKQHTHEQASTTQRTDEQKQRTTESTDIENIVERKRKCKTKD